MLVGISSGISTLQTAFSGLVCLTFHVSLEVLARICYFCPLLLVLLLLLLLFEKSVLSEFYQSDINVLRRLPISMFMFENEVIKS